LTPRESLTQLLFRREQKDQSVAAEQPVLIDWREGAIRALFVEDDDDFREALSWQLEERGFSVHGFADGTALLAALDVATDADLVILDWSLPTPSGIELLTQLRERGLNLPVVFLTGHSLNQREALAFDRGAADFVDKARGVEVLVRRLKLLVKTTSRDPPTEKQLVRGKLILRPTISRAYWGETDVRLTVGEYNIVQLLAANPGEHVSYRSLYDCLHYDGFIAGAGSLGHHTNVRSLIRRIRNKFRACDPTFDEIENYAAFGYRWRQPESDG
jgi:two-component system response regulator ChvI